MPDRLIHRVAIVGGTHGNEFTGVYLIKKWQMCPALLQRDTFATIPILANPAAFAVTRRYVDTDLNRCFRPEVLQQAEVAGYEAVRSRELYQTLKTDAATRVDFVLDLHSTTANMGLTLILVNHHPFNLQLAAYLSRVNPAVRVYSAYQPGQSLAFLNTLCELGFAIEVGAIAQGTLQASLFQQTEALIHMILDYLDAYQQGQTVPETRLTFYQHRHTVDYPKTQAGELLGMIHPQLQGQDYQPLHPGNPMFLTWTGETRYYEGPSAVYPIFINEAAYYEKGIAFCVTDRQTIELESK